MSFGFSVGDFIAASQPGFQVLEALREERDDGAIVVLSFRALQAQRIDEMQQEFHDLSTTRLAAIGNANNEEWLNLNARIDHGLNNYGKYLHPA
jgi:hypothetical protein